MKEKIRVVLKCGFICLLTLSSFTLGAQDIETASRKGNLDELKALLEKGADPNFKWDKQTLLAHGLNDKTLAIPKYLINVKGIRINEWNIMPMPEVSWKYTALMKAVEYPEMVKLLLEKGALIDLQDDWLKYDGMPAQSGGNTPLMLSVAEHTESAKILIEKGAKLDIQGRSGHTALMFAVGNTEIAKLLIDKGAKIDIQNVAGETALMIAAEKYNDVVKLLLDKGANIVLRQSTYKVSPNALDVAARHGNIEAAKLILAKAVSLGVKKEIIYSSLHWAVISDQVAMAQYLLDEGANIEGNDELGGYTPLMETSLLSMVELLVKRGANVNAQNKFNYTPLHKAAFNFVEDKRKENDMKKIMSLLISKKANADAQDKNGNTPLMTAVQKIAPTKLLIEGGANVTMSNKNGETALMYAAKGGLLKVVLGFPVTGPYTDAAKLLISKGADVNSQDVFGKTALMHASGAVNAQGDNYRAYTDLVSLLLDNGASLETTDKEGNTALYWASRYKRKNTTDLLLAKGANPSKQYDKSKDKSNVKAGIVGTWTNSSKYRDYENTLKVVYITVVNKVVFNADWTYKKEMIANGKVVPDGGGYNTYELRDGKIWLFNAMGTNSVLEYRFEGPTLVLNGEKYTKKTK